jgi:hypothetical protein
MKFLIDRCAGRRLADWLRANGHDVVEARQLGPDPGDLALLQLAAERIAIFHELFARHKKDLQNGAIITVRGDKIRVSRAP